MEGGARSPHSMNFLRTMQLSIDSSSVSPRTRVCRLTSIPEDDHSVLQAKPGERSAAVPKR